MARQYRVITNRDIDTGIVNSYGVSDITDKEWELEEKLKKTRTSISDKFKYVHNEEIRPRVATFMVTQLYGAEEQNAMAWALAEYMNKLADAQNQALQQNSLLEVLTSKAAQYKEKEE